MNKQIALLYTGVLVFVIPDGQANTIPVKVTFDGIAHYTISSGRRGLFA